MDKSANAVYWEDRMVNIFLDGEKDVLKVSKELKAQYTKAAKNIEDEILKFYGKYQTASGLDMKTIKKQLSKEELKSFHNTLDEIISYATKHKMDKDYKFRMKLLNMKTRISRLEELKTNIEFEIQKLAIKEQEQLQRAMQNTYIDTYYKTLYEIDSYAGISTSFALPNIPAIEKLINTPINVKNYAVGLYKNKNNLVNILSSYIPQGIILGYNPVKVAKIVSKALDTNYNSTVRLVRTEYNYIMNQAVIDGYKEADIEQYQILAALDERTCTECGELDLRLFEVGNEIIGINYPPFHPNCRCTSIPYFEPDEFDGVRTRVAKDEFGTTYEVPANLKYNDWLDGLNIKNNIARYKN